MVKGRKSWNKKGIELDLLGWWLIAIAVLVIMFLGYMIFSGKATGAIEFIKNLLRFGG